MPNKTIYNVYVRSMTTYTDHPLQHLQSENCHNFAVLLFHNTNKSARKWLLANGPEMTQEYANLHNGEPCVFLIVPEPTRNNLEDAINEKSLYFCNSGSHERYVFNKQCYQMAQDEHVIYLSHDWEDPSAKNIHYVKPDGTEIIGVSKRHKAKYHKYYRHYE